jgi:tellurite methyltransferase
MDEIKPFWEKTYQDDNVSTFSKGPTADVSEFWHNFKKGSTILDVGCGEGRNSIFLASNGFKVDAFDISESGIAKTKRIAENQGVNINAWTQDLIKFEFEKNYDVILSHGVLHFVEINEWKCFIEKIKLHTKLGGYNLIGIFTNRLPATPDNAPFTKGLFDVGALPALYHDWNLLKNPKGIFEDEHPGGIHHQHAYEQIIAQKV